MYSRYRRIDKCKLQFVLNDLIPDLSSKLFYWRQPPKNQIATYITCHLCHLVLVVTPNFYETCLIFVAFLERFDVNFINVTRHDVSIITNEFNHLQCIRWVMIFNSLTWVVMADISRISGKLDFSGSDKYAIQDSTVPHWAITQWHVALLCCFCNYQERKPITVLPEPVGILSNVIRLFRIRSPIDCSIDV